MMSDIHGELIMQIKGLLNIDVGNYLFEKAGIDLYFEGSYELNIYIHDDKYVKPDKYGYVDLDNFEIESKVFIGHYHEDDLLWLLIHYEDEKKRMIKKVDEYLNWR